MFLNNVTIINDNVIIINDSQLTHQNLQKKYILIFEILLVF